MSHLAVERSWVGRFRVPPAPRGPTGEDVAVALAIVLATILVLTAATWSGVMR